MPIGTPTGRRTVLSTVPRPGTVLVASPTAPAVSGVRCVDVRPGTVTIDGDRRRLPLRLRDDHGLQRFDLREVPALEATVAAALAREGRAAVRFGDREACRRLLPAGELAAIERRLARAARLAGETLVTWTRGDPAGGAGGRYDVVLP